jgi:DNA polymerase-3 subunit epsilon
MRAISRVVAIDTETTGLAPGRRHRIIEVAAVRMEADLITTEFRSLIDPERSVSIGTMMVHGITRAVLRSKPRDWNVFERFRDFCGVHSSWRTAHSSIGRIGTCFRMGWKSKCDHRQ